MGVSTSDGVPFTPAPVRTLTDTGLHTSDWGRRVGEVRAFLLRG